MIKTKFPITNKFLDIKEMFKEGIQDIQVFEDLTSELIIDLAKLTEDGHTGDEIIEGIKLDLWKDRVWHLVERAGILPEYKDDDEDDFVVQQLNDEDWYVDSNEFDEEEDEPRRKTFTFDPRYGF